MDCDCSGVKTLEPLYQQHRAAVRHWPPNPDADDRDPYVLLLGALRLAAHAMTLGRAGCSCSCSDTGVRDQRVVMLQRNSFAFAIGDR